MKIGQEFMDATTHQRWRVTDVGTRTFLAVCISDSQVEADPSWLNGPPWLLRGQGDCPCQPPEREGGLFGAGGEQVLSLPMPAVIQARGGGVKT
jgi:hypothetical protein